MSVLENLKHRFLHAQSSAFGRGANHQYYDNARDANSPLLRGPGITPYLGLNARLSQTWINKWTVLLLLVLVRTLMAIVNLNENIGSARKEALSACTSVESVGSAMASMPHYLALGVNELTAGGVDKAVAGLMQMLTLTVTGVEELVVFFINMLTSTYVCLITLVVAGSLHVALSLIEDVAGFLNKTLDIIGNEIQSGISDFESDLNKVVASMDNALKLVGADYTIPTLDVNNSIAALYNLQLPTSLNSDLQTLNSEIPTFAQVNNLTNTAIRWPFEEIKKLIANHTSNYIFDRAIFPVPAKEVLSFCSDNNDIGRFFDGLVETANTARKVAVVVLCLLAIIVCVPMAYREIRRWRTMEQRAQLINSGKYDNLDVTYIVSRPYTATAGIYFAERFQSTRQQALVRWAVAYATTIPALFVLCLGLAGLFSCLCQFLILKAIDGEVPDLEAQITGFADKVVHALENASLQWQNGTNTAILGLQTNVNHDLFSWVNISAVALNDTLNTFVDESIHILNLTFGDTILYTPVTQLFDCLIGLKITGIEKGLTWVSDNAYIDFPLLPNDTFSLGAAASLNNETTTGTFLADPQSGTADRISAAVVSLEQKLSDAIRMEAVISSVVVGVWFVIAAIGIIRALFLWYCAEDGMKTRRPSFAHSIVEDNPFGDEKKLQSDIPMVLLSSAAVPIRTEGQQAIPYVMEDQYSKQGNQYQGVPHTLKSQRLTTAHLPTTHLQPGCLKAESDAVSESLKYAGAREVMGAVKRPNHFRVSSHGALGGVRNGEDPPRK